MAARSQQIGSPFKAFPKANGSRALKDLVLNQIAQEDSVPFFRLRNLNTKSAFAGHGMNEYSKGQSNIIQEACNFC